MNKIYKVIWSKVRGCWVVASEFAKNHTKGGSSRSRVGTYSLASVMAAMLLTGAAQAAETDPYPGVKLLIPSFVAQGVQQVLVYEWDVYDPYHNYSLDKKYNYSRPYHDKALGPDGVERDYVLDEKTKLPRLKLDDNGQPIVAGYQTVLSVNVGKTNPLGSKGPTSANRTADNPFLQQTALADYHTPDNKNENLPYEQRDNSTNPDPDGDPDWEPGYGKDYGGVALGHNTSIVTKPKLVGGYYEQYQAGIAIGDWAQATGNVATAIGLHAQALKSSAMALGPAARAGGINSLAMMRQSSAAGDYSTAIGTTAYAKGTGSLAMGFSATATGQQAVAIGVALPEYDKTSDGFPATSYDGVNNTEAAGAQSFAIGTKAKTTKNATASVAFGQETNVDSEDSIAVGRQAKIEGTAGGSMALGKKATVKENATDAMALGSGTEVAGAGSVALGLGTKTGAEAAMALALGGQSEAKKAASIVMGSFATSKDNAENAIAVGTNAGVSGSKSMAMGFGSLTGTEAEDGIALGSNAEVNASGAMAIGKEANAGASAQNSMAIGVQSIVNGAHSVAIGEYAQVDGNKSMLMGFGEVIPGKTETFPTFVKTEVQGDKGETITYYYNSELKDQLKAVYMGTGKTEEEAEKLAIEKTRKQLSDQEIKALTDETNEGKYQVEKSTGNLVPKVASITIAPKTVYSKVTGNNSIGIGNSIDVSGDSAIAIGNNTKVTTTNSITIGDASVATGVQSVNLGIGGEASGAMAMNLGSGGIASGPGATNLGMGGQATGNSALNLGPQGTASGEQAVSVGSGGNAAGINSLNFGTLGNSTKENAINIGTGGRAYGINSINMGTKGRVVANNSMSFGFEGAVNEQADNSISIGNKSIIDSSNSLSFGNNNKIELSRKIPLYVLSDNDIDLSLKLTEWYISEGKVKLDQLRKDLADQIQGTENYKEIKEQIDELAANMDKAQKEYDEAIIDAPRMKELRSKAFVNGVLDVTKLTADELTEFKQLALESFDVPLHDVVALGNNITDTTLNSVFLGNNTGYVAYHPEYSTREEAVFVNGKLAPSQPGVETDPNDPSTYVSVPTEDIGNSTRGIDNTYNNDTFYVYRHDEKTGEVKVTEVNSNFAGGDSVVGTVSVGGRQAMDANGNGITVKREVSVYDPGSNSVIKTVKDIPVYETRRIQNVAPGLISSVSTDAINGSQLYGLSQIVGNLATSIADTVGGGATVNPDGSVNFMGDNGSIGGTQATTWFELMQILRTDVRGDVTKTLQDNEPVRVTNGAAEVTERRAADGHSIFDVHVDQFIEAGARNGNDIVKGGDNKYYETTEIADKTYVPNFDGSNNPDGSKGHWYSKADVDANVQQRDGKWFNKEATKDLEYTGGKWYHPDDVKDYVYYNGHWYNVADTNDNGKPNNTAPVVDSTVEEKAQAINEVTMNPLTDGNLPKVAVLEDRVVDPNTGEGTRLLGVESALGDYKPVNGENGMVTVKTTDASVGNGVQNGTTIGADGIVGNNTFLEKLQKVGAVDSETGKPTADSISRSYAATLGDLKDLSDTPMFFEGNAGEYTAPVMNEEGTEEITAASNTKNTFDRKMGQLTKIVGDVELTTVVPDRATDNANGTEVDAALLAKAKELDSKLSDGNIGVVSNGKNTLTVKLAKDINGLTSITTTNITEEGDTYTTVVNGEGVTTTKDGKDGADGTPGKDGKTVVGAGTITIQGQGIDGKDGQPGKDGKPGANATITVVKGTDGIDGKNGKDGMTRIIYNDGTTNHEVATLDDGLKFGANTAATGKDNPKAVKLGETVNILGGDKVEPKEPEGQPTRDYVKNTSFSGKNIKTVIDGNDINIQMADKPEFNQVTVKDDKATAEKPATETVIGNNGVTITPVKDGKAVTDAKDKISLTDEGLSNGGKQITNVASGLGDKTLTGENAVTDKDDEWHNAATIGDLKTAADAAKSEVTGTGAAEVTSTTAADGHSVYNVHVDKVVEFKAADGSDVVYGADGKYYKPGTIENLVYVDGKWYNKADVKDGKPIDGKDPVAVTPETIKSSLVNPNADNDVVLDNVGSAIGGEVKVTEEGPDKGKNTFIDNLNKAGKAGGPALDAAVNVQDLKNVVDTGIKLNTEGQGTTGATTVKIGDTINVVNGANTKVSAITNSTANDIHTFHVDVVGIPATYVDAAGNALTKQGDDFVRNDGTKLVKVEGNYYTEDQLDNGVPKDIKVNSNPVNIGLVTPDGTIKTVDKDTWKTAPQLKYVGSGLGIYETLDQVPDTELSNAVNVGDLKKLVEKGIGGSATRPIDVNVTATGAATISDKYDLYDNFNVHVDQLLKVSDKNADGENVYRANDNHYYTETVQNGKLFFEGMWYDANELDPDKVTRLADKWYNKADIVDGVVVDGKVYRKDHVVNGKVQIDPETKQPYEAIKDITINPLPTDQQLTKEHLASGLRLEVANPNSSDPIAVGNVASSLVDENGKALTIGNGAEKLANVDEKSDSGVNAQQEGTNQFIDKLKSLDRTADKATLNSVVTVADLKNAVETPLFYEGDVADANTSPNTFGRTLGQKTQIIGGVTADANTEEANKADNIRGKLTDGNIGVVSNGVDTLTVKLAKKLTGLESAEFTKTIKGENGQPDVTTKTTIGSDGVTTDGTFVVNGKGGEDGEDGKNAVEIGRNDDGSGHIVLNGKDGKDGQDGATGATGANGAPAADITVVQGDAGLQNNTVEDKDPKYMDRIQYKDSAGKDHQVATMDDGLIFTGNIGDNVKRPLGTTLTIKGDMAVTTKDAEGKDLTPEEQLKDYNDRLSNGNIGVVSNSTDGLTVKLAKNLTDMSSIGGADGKDGKISFSSVETEVPAEQEGQPATTVTTQVVDMNGSRVSNVQSGLKGDDGKQVALKDAKDGMLTNAVNVGDLQNAVNNITNGTDKGAIGGFGLTGNNGTVKQDLGKAITVKGGMASADNATAENTYVDVENDTLVVKINKKLTGMTSAEFGQKGEDGKDGQPGKPGVDGQIGVRGADGAAVVINGKDGSIGLKGADGKDGKDGVSANITVKEGKPGINGKDGETMTRIVYKDGKDGKEHQVATLDDGLKFGANTAATGKDNPVAVTLGGTVNILGGNKIIKDGKTIREYVTDTTFSGKNIKTVIDGNDINIQMADKPEFKGVTVKDGADKPKTEITNNGVTITPAGEDGKSVSLTDKGLDNGKKQITNVASGFNENENINSESAKTNTNAANISDLANAADQIKQDITKGTGEGATGGFGLTGNNGAVKQDLGKEITIKGGMTEGTNTTDQNTYVAVKDKADGTGKELVVEMAKDLTDLNSVTTGDDKAGTTMNKDGITITKPGKNEDGKDITKTVSLTGDGLNNGGNKITNVAKGDISEKSTDAVNGSQLWNAMQGTKTHLENGKNTTVDGDGTKDNPYKVNVADNLNLGAKDGKDGKDGINGSIGVNGKDGSAVVINGKDGSIGLNGKDGANGLTIKGDKGADGIEGKNGKDGMTRIIYETKDPKNPETVIRHEVATMNDGLYFAGDVAKDKVNEFGRKMNEKVTIKGGQTDKDKLSDNNIGVVSNGNGTLEVKLAKDLKGLDSITVGADGKNGINGTSITKDGIVVGANDGKGGITINKDSDDVKSIKDGDTHLVTGNAVFDYIQKNGTDPNAVKYDDGSHTSVTLGGKEAKGPVTLTNVKDGRVAPGSTDAVNGSQLYQTNANVNKLSSRINRVGAGAAALAALHPLDFDPDEKWDITAGYGNYNGANAVALGAFYRPNEDTLFSIGTSMGGGENMVNAGVTIKLGQGNNISTSRVAMAKEIRDLREEVAQLKAVVAAGHPQSGIDLGSSALFPDVKDNHWAYEYVTKLADAGLLKGYPDGEFKGNRVLTRYEFATVVYRMLEQGLGSTDDEMNALVKEFASELKYISIDTVHKDKDGNPTVQRVRTTEYARTHA